MTSSSMGNPEILQLIKQDHDAVRGLFTQFEQAIESDIGRGRDISQKVLQELEVHTQLEEQIVYPELKRLDQDLFNEAEQEHHVADLLINELKSTELDEPVLKAKMLVLRESVYHHMREEESAMFDQIRRVEQGRLQQMGQQWRTQKPQITQTVQSGATGGTQRARTETTRASTMGGGTGTQGRGQQSPRRSPPM